MKKRNPFPGVTRVEDRHGKVRWRFRSKGLTCYLPGPYASAEFRAAYEQAVAGAKAPARSTAQRGTLGWLIEQYLAGARYRDLSAIRKTTLRRELDWLREVAGKYSFTRLEVRHVEALMAKKDGPAAANTVKKNASLLFNYAIKQGYTQHNPAKFADRRKENPDGYHTWTEDEIQRFLDQHGPGTLARLVCLLILNTGAARQDLLRLGWQSVKRTAKGDRIEYRRGKTHVGADLPILGELAEELRNVPTDQMMFIISNRGRPYTLAAFGNWFRKRCREAGLEGCSAHGLRKAGATRLANAGATPDEIRAFLAHATNAEGATYTKNADRARLADSGLARLSGSKPEQTLSNLSDGLDKQAL